MEQEPGQGTGGSDESSSSLSDIDAPDVLDLFDIDRPPGKVIANHNQFFISRAGVDVERVFSIDNGALRIMPLLEPGWNRACLEYGPFQRGNGLALAVFMLNGHNTAQAEQLPESLRARFSRWWIGSETSGRFLRLRQWLNSGRTRRTMRNFRWWLHLRRSRRNFPRIDENLVVGWFPRERSDNPIGRGNAFVMHATGPENGELWTSTSLKPTPVLGGVQNLPLYFVVLLRERGAVYYASSLPAGRNLPGYPLLRPLSIDQSTQSEEVYARVMQSTMGQIGFRHDTRVYGVRVAQIPSLDRWYGTAQVADTLLGDGQLLESEATQPSGTWRVLSGALSRTASGLRGIEPNSLAIVSPPAPTGLVHALLTLGSESGVGGLIFRFWDAKNYLALELSPGTCELVQSMNGRKALVNSCAWVCGERHRHSVQVLDDGRDVRCIVDGELIFSAFLPESPHSECPGVGLHLSDDSLRITHFEAHPRAIPMPEELDLGSIEIASGEPVAIVEEFEGPARPLEGKTTTDGGGTWRRLFGNGTIDLTGDGRALVRANRDNPNPGRTVFTISWPDGPFAELELAMTPPGERRGQGELIRTGFVLWENSENYVIINAWNSDCYEGASVSSFFHIDGFEDLYDAVWTNVGCRIRHGREVLMKTVFDGQKFLVFLDEEPVLFRALSDVYPSVRELQITQVGLAVNWEWGNDTGTSLRRFVARTIGRR